jgi:hypothetical protein
MSRNEAVLMAVRLIVENADQNELCDYLLDQNELPIKWSDRDISDMIYEYTDQRVVIDWRLDDEE